MFRRPSELFEWRRSPALSSTGVRPAELSEQRVVLHVPGTDLDHVGDFEHWLGSRTSISSVTIGSPVSSLAGRDAQAFLAKPWKA